MVPRMSADDGQGAEIPSPWVAAFDLPQADGDLEAFRDRHMHWQCARGGTFLGHAGVAGRMCSRLIAAHRVPDRVLVDFFVLSAEIHLIHGSRPVTSYSTRHVPSATWSPDGSVWVQTSVQGCRADAVAACRRALRRSRRRVGG